MPWNPLPEPVSEDRPRARCACDLAARGNRREGHPGDAWGGGMPLSTNPRFGAILSAGFEPADRRTKKVDLSRTTAFLVPSIALAGGLGLAFWSIYSDYLRRRPPEPASRVPEDQEPTLVGGRQCSGRAMRRADSVTLGLEVFGLRWRNYIRIHGARPGGGVVGETSALV